MYRDKRIFLFFLALIVCLSIWQITDQQIIMQTFVFSLLNQNTTPYVYPIKELPKNDVKQLMNISNFEFKIFNGVCNAKLNSNLQNSNYNLNNVNANLRSSNAYLNNLNANLNNLNANNLKRQNSNGNIQNLDLQNLNYQDYNFQYLNSNFENDENTNSLLLLILIHSAPCNFEKRRTIRETWGQKRPKMKLLFMLGDTNNKTMQNKLNKENEKHKDFIQGNFIDSYRNMTYKHVMVLKYAVYHCPNAKYILKTDDDMFLNTAMMLYFLENVMSPFGAKNFLFCNVYANTRVIRSYRSKWRVGFSEYSDRYYPDYCPGWGLLYSQDVLFSLYKAVQNSSYYWIDDVLITGTLTKKLKIQITNAFEYILTSYDLRQVTEGKTVDKMFLFGPANLSEKEIRLLWNYVLKHPFRDKN